MSVFRNLLMQSTGWLGKPADWSDIRKDCPANSIALYAGHTPLQQWTLGDRLDNKATFVGYFDSVNPDTNTAQRYAYFVLDAQYRSSSKLKDNTSGALSADSPIPVNATYEDALARTESATYNCTKLEAVGTFPPIDFAKTVSVSYNGNTYYGVIPNAAEILEIYNNRETLDTYDPTVADYTTQSLTSWGGLEFWTSSAANSSAENGLTFWKKRDKNFTPWTAPGQINNSNFAAKACPIIEIPIDNSNIQYDNLGFTATCTGGYNVFIDGTQYGSTYASGAQCNITWSTSGITTGDDITTPTALKAHKIWIEPATEGNNITAFSCKRVAASGTEYQGVLWAHFNLTNTIRITELFCLNYPYNCQQRLVKALTAKNNLVKCSSNYATASFANTNSLEYIPIIDNLYAGVSCFYYSNKIKTIKLTNPYLGLDQYCFDGCNSLKELKISNPRYGNSGNFNSFLSSTMLKKFPDLDWSKVKQANNIWTDYNRQLNDGEPTIIDARAGNQITKLGIRNTNSLVGLRVSNEAPFTGATPQINVSNTNLDRQALVQLFNDLPSVSAGQIISIVDATGASDLTADDEAIATAKGWTITK